jgi:hypothetical protein
MRAEVAVSKRLRLQVLLNGVVVLLVGFLCGVPYSQAILNEWGESAIRGWRTAHLGLVVGGIWLIATAGVLDLVRLGPTAISTLVALLIASGYGFSVALVVAAMSGERGLAPAPPLFNGIAFAANTVGAGAALASLVLMIAGIVSSLRSSGRRPD